MAGYSVNVNHVRWLRFSQASSLVLCAAWIVACSLMYWFAPSFQIDKLYDCRWHLSSLLISGGFSYLFLRSSTPLIYAAAFISGQYSMVYCFMSMVIYSVDCVVLLSRDPSEPVNAISEMDFSMYLKLAAVMIVLSAFGLFVSMILVHRMLLIGWEMALPRRPTSMRAIQVLSGVHAAFALFTMYVIEELTHYRTWFVRVYLVHDFGCSLLGLSLAVLQMTSLAHPNPVVMLAVFAANLCQFVQDLHIGTTAFYTAFYVQKLSQATSPSATVAHVVIGLNLVVHIARMGMCAATAWILAPSIWSSELRLRVQRKVDTERLTAAQDYVVALAKENRWLLYMCAWALVIAVGHAILDVAYVLLDSIMEALMIAAGTTFFFSLLILAGIVLYMRRRYRLALVCCAYFALNLLVSSSLLVTSFVQDVVLGPAGLAPRSTLLYTADIALSALTMYLAISVLRFSTRSLLQSYTLMTQTAAVTRAVRFLRNIALVLLLTVAMELALLLEMRIDAKIANLSMSSSIHDWLINAVQSVFLYWATKHERYQCCLLVIVLQLSSVVIVSLDILAQQTDLMQMLITVVVQHNAYIVNTESSTVSAFPMAHFVIIMVLHFLQVVQWLLAVAAVATALYIVDNVVVDDSTKSNDNHEINVLRMGIDDAPLPVQTALDPVDHPHSKTTPKTNGTGPRKPSTGANGGMLAFENALFNDPLAMSRLPDLDSSDSSQATTVEMDVVDVPLDDHPQTTTTHHA